MTGPIAMNQVANDRAGRDDMDAILALEQTGFALASRWIAASWLPELTRSDRFAPVFRDATGTVRGVAAFQVIAEVADLNRVVVDPGLRGRGIGRALLEAGFAWAAERGAERMLLEVEWANEPALALYRRLGFVEVSYRTNYYGISRDALVMQRDLNDCGGPTTRVESSDLEELDR